MEILLISPAICDEPGGNGEIIVRFRGVNDSLLAYCTLGLENERGLLGTVYLYNGFYDEYAEGITSTRTIKFTTTPPAYWGNAGVVRGYADLRGTPSPGDSGIVLELVDRDMITYTLNNGFYEFLAVPPGRYFVRATYTGYNFDVSPSFTISERETVFLDTLFITPILPSNKYVEDFEDNPQPGVFSGEWEWGSVNVDSFRYSTVPPQTAPPPGAHSGTKMWGTLLNGEYKNASCDTLIFPAGPEIITFWHYYDTEPTRDGGIVLYSEDFCQSWQMAHPLGGYDDSVYALGDSGFTGSSGAWVKDSVDLRGTAATNIAFVFASDSIGTAAGWYLDDIFVIRPARKTGTITGYVYDNVDYTPVVNALVFGGEDSAYTDGIGYFVLDSADAGIYDITVQCPGYITNSVNILLGKGDTFSLNIPLYKIEISPEDTSDYEFEFSYGQHDTQTVQICNPASDTVQVGIVVSADDSTPGEIGICDSIVIDDVPSMSIPVAVGCRGKGHLSDYWITSYDPAVGNRYNFKFDDAKNYTGVRYSTIPYTGLTEIAGDMTYDGRYFWQTVPGRNTIYAWNPNDGNLVDSIVAPAWAGWHSADTLVCGIGYDVVNDVFYL
ncbi:MAG TPA: hypothetical protein ENG11_06080, partial [candidate division Zixibacteria bacterium]|nr:hypothetical protein [candidate division Zixibacteria bacterium]